MARRNMTARNQAVLRTADPLSFRAITREAADVRAAREETLAILNHLDPVGFNPHRVNPLVMLKEVAPAVGYPLGTLYQWHNRSRPEYTGPGSLEWEPFPSPEAPWGRWRLYDVVEWLVRTGRWDKPAAVARRSAIAADLAA